MRSLPTPVVALATAQDGLVARRQLLHLGATAQDVRRWRQQHLLDDRAAGVYAVHTGPLSWRQQAWVALLATSPSALFGPSALLAVDPEWRGLDRRADIHVAVPTDRRISAPSGVRVHRVTGLDLRDLDRVPPRTSLEDAVLDTAAMAPDDTTAMAVITRAVGSRRTTATRLADALGSRDRIRRREVISAVLTDVRGGAQSPLEIDFVRLVERPHGLPTARRQAPARSAGRIYRDAHYEQWGVVIELDGRADHTDPDDRRRDADRDLDAALQAQVTVRLTTSHVRGRPCDTASRIGRLLNNRGWPGHATRCRHCSSGGSRST